jgi:hypothetical protein
MGVIKIIFLMTLSLLLVVSTVTLVTVTGMWQLLNPGLYHQAFEQSNFYELLSQQLPTKRLGITIPEETVQQITDCLVYNTLQYLSGEKEVLDLTVTIDTIFLKRALDKKINSLPICQPGIDLETIEITCVPLDRNASEYIYEILEYEGITIFKEEKIDLKPYLGDFEAAITKLKYYIQISETLLLYSLVTILSIITFILFFNGFSLKNTIDWIGAAVTISGLILVGGVYLARRVLENYVVSSTFFAKEFFYILASSVLTIIMFYGLFVTMVAIALIIISFAFSDKKKDKLRPND